ncbi:YqaA family protein [Promethearchaeum syntrophicum]|uniref:YqaA family protein n=1 Tax=Promethearchaeum syntrophicum TaxID=2594042 RepID=A0A5B9D8Y7_9ARCH|nr:VTT domain-containing protein [Candidatus Prometheoarchaeum syntrophicum]QEE15327.1 SNARE associated Golgi protein [Candidatus Prometheoarchaeum syntrophicum]
MDKKFRIGKFRFRIRNLEIFTFVILTFLYVLAFIIKEDTWIYDNIASLSMHWHDIAVGSTTALLTAFAFATFGNTSILIVFPYILIVYDIAQSYPNWILLGIVSGLGAAVGEITSYIIGRVIGASKKMKSSEMGEKFHRIKLKFEEKPARIPLTVFFFALTPFPDDAILVPLGMMKYPYWKSIPPCFLGKTILCTLIAWLGSFVAVNLDPLNALIDDYPILFFLRLIIPTTDVNPSADIIQFSFVFIIIYIMLRLDFEKISMKRSKDRKQFQTYILEGGNFEISKLIEDYNVLNIEGFKSHIQEFAQRHNNVAFMRDLLHLDAIADRHLAFDQSMDFISFFYTPDKEQKEKEEKQEINDKKEEKIEK